MKNYISLIAVFLSFGFSTVMAQVTMERIADLQPENYPIMGDAILEEMSNGDLTLSLSSDFSTPAGPDVRIFLSNAVSISGALEIANLSDISHFSGAITFDVPAGTGIEDYDFVVFYCFAFSQLWASGELGPSMPPGGGGFNCQSSTTMTSGGASTVDICPSDGDPDVINFSNSLGVPAGDHYAYLITDANQVLQEVVTTNSFDFEGSGSDEQRVYGIHYDGTLVPAIGQDRTMTTATNCFEHSNGTTFLTVTKNACPPPFQCLQSLTFTTGVNTEVDICPTDGNPDVIDLLNNINVPAGDHYAFLITDAEEVLQEVVLSGSYDFEGSGLDEQRVYGVHFDGQLVPMIGEDRMQTTATGCYMHSNGGVFLTVLKNACPPPPFDCMASNTFTTGQETEVDICPDDGEDDIVELLNSLSEIAGDHYAYLITDAAGILEAVVYEDSYNFEGSGPDEQRVYGIHFDGTLNPAIGEDRLNTTATECHEHSSANEFLTITKNACPPPPFDCMVSTTFTTGQETEVDICPDDGEDDIVELLNSLSEMAGDHYAYLITDSDGILEAVIYEDSYNFEGSGSDEQRVYGIHFDGTLNPAIGEDRLNTTATECFEHSSSSEFLTVTKNACAPPPTFECEASNTFTIGQVTEVDICPDDGQDDNIALLNSLSEMAGDHYAYLITDAAGILEAVIYEDSYNFEGSGPNEQRVYGIHFDGTLNPAIGEDRLNTTATECHEHSNASEYLTVTKEGCSPPPPFECEESFTATTGLITIVDICPEDGMADNVEFVNTISAPPGDHYAYLITDANQVLQEVVFDDSYDFEGSGLEEQRVYGVHFDGDLVPAIGENRTMTTATGCYEHSGELLYLTILKDACPPPPPFICETSGTTSTSGATEIDICPEDGMADEVELLNDLMAPLGDHYAYLITDANQVLQEVVLDGQYDFEGSGLEEQRVYGVHFDGDLVPAIGQNRMMTTATECYEHSSDDMYLTITKNACPPPPFVCEESISATTGWVTEVDICAEDGMADEVELLNNLNVEPGDHYAYLITDANEVLQEVVYETSYDFEGSGLDEQRVYGIHFDGQLIPLFGSNRLETVATGCYEHSGDDLFLTVTKNGCPPPPFECETSITATTGWITEVDICPEDGMADEVELLNNLMVDAGDYYAYLITDANQILQEVVLEGNYDFEGSSLEEQRVYGIHFGGDLVPAIGQNRMMTTATGCYEHSGDNLFLTVTKSACPSGFECVESLTASYAWVTDVDVCATDGQADNVFLQNNIMTPPGDHYVFLLTDSNEILQEVIIDTVYNFEGTGVEEQRVYGLSYAGQLNPVIGEHRENTTASECFIHSGENLFITIHKTAACVTSVIDVEIAEQVLVYPNPTSRILNLELPESFVPEQVDLINLLGVVEKNIPVGPSINYMQIDVSDAQAGQYILRLKNKEHMVFKKVEILR